MHALELDSSVALEPRPARNNNVDEVTCSFILVNGVYVETTGVFMRR